MKEHWSNNFILARRTHLQVAFQTYEKNQWYFIVRKKQELVFTSQ